MELKGKRALITGSGRGLGREIALTFAREGADIIINSVHQETADKVAEEVRALGSKALAIPADVSSFSEVCRMFGEIQKKFGGLDILVNNAAVVLPVSRGTPYVKHSEELDVCEWKRVFEINLDGTFFCCQAAARCMIPKKSGRIINIASTRGKRPKAMEAPYCCSKSAVIMLTKVLALEWIVYGIHVNAIAPGIMITDMVLDRVKSGALELEPILSKLPLKRAGSTEEIARVALFLASNECDYLIGQTIFVDGGFLLT